MPLWSYCSDTCSSNSILYQRFFWRVGAGHCKDLTETGNRGRKVSGTQGTLTAAFTKPGFSQLPFVQILYFYIPISGKPQL